MSRSLLVAGLCSSHERRWISRWHLKIGFGLQITGPMVRIAHVQKICSGSLVGASEDGSVYGIGRRLQKSVQSYAHLEIISHEITGTYSLINVYRIVAVVSLEYICPQFYNGIERLQNWSSSTWGMNRSRLLETSSGWKSRRYPNKPSRKVRPSKNVMGLLSCRDTPGTGG